ncbi:MAG: NUDIX hydrolase, partial [Thermoguttaceae bacterium]
MNGDLPDRLAACLGAALPGLQERSLYAAVGRPGPGLGEIPPIARRAAVLALLYPIDGRWHLPLTLRPQHLPDHAGQVSLPGGAVESGETPQEAAVREFHEELGAEDLEPRILGALSPIYVQVSNYRVDPLVAACDRRPRFVPNGAEVDRVL